MLDSSLNINNIDRENRHNNLSNQPHIKAFTNSDHRVSKQYSYIRNSCISRNVFSIIHKIESLYVYLPSKFQIMGYSHDDKLHNAIYYT